MLWKPHLLTPTPARRGIELKKGASAPFFEEFSLRRAEVGVHAPIEAGEFGLAGLDGFVVTVCYHWFSIVKLLNLVNR